ncbi:outer membrane protein transport protein [Halomonas sp. YLGW01]|uniref:OmpP1/FadL family transporter n=1 Tax=Halomonas sp. YLGW01 TaxID=2773308 RepID=UPI00178507E7|nr:outer membrane protein transport protein [Halomonas sp. YLGW01]
MHYKINKLAIAVALASASLVASQALASGFQVREQSAKTLANALSNAAAGAEDVSFMAYNPAALGNIDGNQFAVGVAYIDADFELKDAEASSTSGADYDKGGSRQGGESAVVPSLAVKTQASERIDLGLAIFSPYGLSTKYDEDWIGRYHAIETELTTIDIQPTLNFRVTERWSVAAGLIAEYGDATISNAIDLGAGVSAPGQYDGKAKVTGDDWGYGFILGTLFQVTDRTRLGLSYRSEIDLTLDGEVDYSSDSATGQAVLTTLGREDGGGTADLSTPANANVGVFHQLTPRLALMANVSWTGWSSFEELRVKFDDENAKDSFTEENWNDSWAYSVGANYALTDNWLLRTGVGYDETPVPSAEYRTPRVPDADRTWATLGATYQVNDKLGVTAGYMHVFGDDGDIDQEATPTNENKNKGNLSGTYEVAADVFALSMDYRF